MTVIAQVMKVLGKVGDVVDKVGCLFGPREIDDMPTEFPGHGVHNGLIPCVDPVPVPLRAVLDGTEEGLLELLGIQRQILVHLAIPVLDDDVLSGTPLLALLSDLLGGGTRPTADARVDEARMPVANEEEEGVGITRRETTCQLSEAGTFLVVGSADVFQHNDVVDGLVAVFVLVLVDLALVIRRDQTLQTHGGIARTSGPHTEVLGIGR
mmetsp:Transcript_5498/g.13153  ORF Transcript_5498/g.13153 Transcript_5498/m.13153 type:complete len:210 (-) Transcript_5498:285-914(-)